MYHSMDGIGNDDFCLLGFSSTQAKLRNSKCIWEIVGGIVRNICLTCNVYLN